MAPPGVRASLPAPEGFGRLITLDTSGLLALFDVRDRNHQQVLRAFDGDPGPHVVPAAILGEVGHLLARESGSRAVTRFLLDLADGLYDLDCGDSDLARAAALAQRYESLSVGLVDAAVIACAERLGGRVLTLDRRHFDVVGRELGLEVLP